MRVEPYMVGSYLHVIKRGARGMEIFRDVNDFWRFVKSLFYLNNNHTREVQWEQEVNSIEGPLFSWPRLWKPRDKLVEIVAFVLMPNHFHLLLKEIREKGISLFMQGLCGSMSLSFNEKYKEKGSIFQGAYKGKVVDTDEYFRRVATYIMVKNSFELLPGGIQNAMRYFDESWKKAIENPFSSLADYASNRRSPLIDRGLLGELFNTPKKFKMFAKETMEGRNTDTDLENLLEKASPEDIKSDLIYRN